MSRAGNEGLDIVVITHPHAFDPTATTVLDLEFILGHTFDVTIRGQGNQDIFFLNQVFIFDACQFANTQFRPAFTWEAILDICQFVFNNSHNVGL